MEMDHEPGPGQAPPHFLRAPLCAPTAVSSSWRAKQEGILYSSEYFL